VVRDGRLIGLVTAENIGELLMMRTARAQRGGEAPPAHIIHRSTPPPPPTQ